MQYRNYGLPDEAAEFLKENRMAVGEPCWCCNLPVTQPIVKIGEAPDGIDLNKHLLKSKGLLAEEFVQTTLTAGGIMHIYLGLRVKPDGVLAFGNGKTIEWKT